MRISFAITVDRTRRYRAWRLRLVAVVNGWRRLAALSRSRCTGARLISAAAAARDSFPGPGRQYVNRIVAMTTLSAAAIQADYAECACEYKSLLGVRRFYC